LEPAQCLVHLGARDSGKRQSLSAIRHLKWRRHLDGEPATVGTNHYHYPSAIQAKDGAIHMTYSYFVPEGRSI
jgi:hypothetical protein